MLNKHLLEEKATELREILGFDSETILNPSHFDELISKMEVFENFIKVKRNSYGDNRVILQDEKYFTICVSDDEKDKERFYNLVEMFVFVLLFDKKALNGYQLQHSEYEFPCYHLDQDGEAIRYFARAFMMPQRAFFHELCKYSLGDGSVRMFEMKEEVNKYCYGRYNDLTS